jgi:hypothetical protein
VRVLQSLARITERNRRRERGGDERNSFSPSRFPLTNTSPPQLHLQMKAVFVSKTGREIKDYPIPTPGPGEVLIKSTFVSSARSGTKPLQRRIVGVWIAVQGIRGGWRDDGEVKQPVLRGSPPFSRRRFLHLRWRQGPAAALLPRARHEQAAITSREA